MNKSISKPARAEVILALHQRFQSATKKEKMKILDEFVAVSHCHCKHGIRLLGNNAGAFRCEGECLDESMMRQYARQVAANGAGLRRRLPIRSPLVRFPTIVLSTSSVAVTHTG